MSDPFGDTFPGHIPTVDGGTTAQFGGGGRRRGLFDGLRGHVSQQHVDHFQDLANRAGDTARTLGGDAMSRGIDFAANNPDKMEKIGERAGRVIGAAAISPILGGKAGKKAGKKLGGMLSRKAQERQGGGSSSDRGTSSMPPLAGGNDKSNIPPPRIGNDDDMYR